MFCYRWSKLQWTLVGHQALRTLLCPMLASYARCQTGTAFLHPLKPLKTLSQATHLQTNLPRHWANCRYLIVGHTPLLCHSCLSACCENLVPFCRLQLCTAEVQGTGRTTYTFMCFPSQHSLSVMPGRHPCTIWLCMLLQQNHCKYWQLSCCVHAKTDTVLCHGEGCNFG